MVEMASLYNDIKKQGISLFTYDVGDEKSVTLEIKNKYAVFIDPFQFESISEMKRALAHEIGHCATGCTHKVSSPLDLVTKHEYEANRWAIEQYIPFEELRLAISKGYTEEWQLAEYFDFPQNFIHLTLEYYFEIKQKKIG